MKPPVEDGSMLVFSEMERRVYLYICLCFVKWEREQAYFVELLVQVHIYRAMNNG